MKWRALIATSLLLVSLLLVSTSAFARTPDAHGRRHRRHRRLDFVALRAAAVAREAGRRGPIGDAARLEWTSAPAPSPAPSISALLPPGVVAALVAAAARSDAPPAATDGLSWRELRPQDESGRRIVPLAIGRF